MKKALESYLVFLEAGGRARRTVQTYQQRLGWLFGWLEGRGIVELDGIGPEHLDAYVAGLYHRDLSLVTIAGCVQAAKTFFRWCEGRNYLERSPASHLTKPALPRGGRSKAMALTDLRKLVEEAERRAEAGHPRDLAVITLLADSGARVGELVGLELDDLVLDEYTAWVDGKTGPRAIDFTERTSAALWAWLAVRPDVDHQSVFVAVGGSSRGEALTAYAVRGILRRLAGKAGADNYSGKLGHMRPLSNPARCDACEEPHPNLRN